MTFQSLTRLKVKINESLLGDMNTRVWNLYMNMMLQDGQAKIDRQYSNSSYIVFRVDHMRCYGCSYGIANNTDRWLEVTLDMTDSPNWYFTPLSGEARVIVFPNSLKYLGSTVSDPNAEEVTFMRELNIEEIDTPEEYADLESDESEGEDSEGEESEEEESEGDDEEAEGSSE